jgi:hypothetical protein
MLATVVIATVTGVFGAAGGWLFNEATHVTSHVKNHLAGVTDRVSVLEFTKKVGDNK